MTIGPMETVQMPNGQYGLESSGVLGIPSGNYNDAAVPNELKGMGPVTGSSKGNGCLTLAFWSLILPGRTSSLKTPIWTMTSTQSVILKNVKST